VLETVGAKPLRDLTAGDVRKALGQLTSRYSTRSLQITRNSLDRAIQHAQANDLVARNVAALVKPPRGRAGRPSKSFALDQARALLAAGEGTRMHAYVALSLLVGIRTEEARALRWDHVVRWAGDAAGWQPVTTIGRWPLLAGWPSLTLIVQRYIKLYMSKRAMQEATFLILTALAAGSQHGYGIITDVQELSGGRVRLQAGTLYTALDRLRTEGLVCVDREEIVDSRLRRYYRLTPDGSDLLAAEAARLRANARAALARLNLAGGTI